MIISISTETVTFSIAGTILENYYDNEIITMSSKMLSKFPHDAVCRSLGLFDTDHLLSNITPLKQPSDALTPDFIIKNESSVVVLEVKTAYYDSMIDQKLKEATTVYEDECKVRCDILHLPLDFNVVVVTTNKVKTFGNYASKLNTTDSIKVYLAALSIKSMAEYEGWSYDVSEEDSSDLKQMYEGLKKLTLDSESKLPIISEYIKNHWSELSAKQAELVSHDYMMKEATHLDKLLLNKYDGGVESLIIENHMRTSERIRKFEAEHDSHYNSQRLDDKSPIQLPFVVIKNRSGSDLNDHHKSIRELQPFIEQSDSLSRLWYNSIIHASTNSDRFMKASESNVRKNNRFRVKPKIDSSDKRELALSGLEAKTFQKDEILNELLEKTHFGFKLNCRTDDIDYFMNMQLLKTIEMSSTERTESLDALLDKAQTLYDPRCLSPGFTDDHRVFVKTFSETILGNALELISIISEEINLSRSQYCRKGEFILKKLPTKEAFLLIKSTTSDGPIFFSLLIHKDNLIYKVDKPFKELKLYGDVYIMEFVSMNKHIITHNLFAREKTCSILATWLHLYNITPMQTTLDKIPEEIQRHLNICTLVWLEGKEQTSKELQQVRYAYMEVVRHNHINYDPLKILEKWDSFSRSRLLVWCRKRIMTCFKSTKLSQINTSVIPLTKKDYNASLDTCNGIFSWVTHNSVPKFEIALNLSYLGSLHNKEHTVEIHGMLKVYTKVVKEELKMRNCREHNMGLNDPPLEELRDHEFSKCFVAHMGDCVKQEITERFGSCEQHISSRFNRAILSRDLLVLSTLKKSATGDLDRVHHDPASLENQRRSCLESSLDFINKYGDGRPMKNVGKLASEVKREYGGVVCNLFKKLQIGGVREIFVLEFRCRIIIHFLETLCRVVCEDLPNEMLTKGDQKLTRSDEHFFSVRSDMREGLKPETVINSDDATTWAQRFVMSSFGLFLSRFMPTELITPIFYILNLVTNKKLELPSALLKLYAKNEHVTSTDSSMQELKDQFLGRSKHCDLLDPGCRMLKNTSNMMQGILHYTSSLYHAGYMIALKRFSVKYINDRMPKYGISNWKYIFTSKVSSDDSSLLQTLLHDHPNDEKSMIHPMCVISELKTKLYPLLCAEHSYAKSTSTTLSGVEEFNSLWYYKNTLMSPIIKFVASSMKVHTNTRMTDRFNSLANLRKDILEHGGNVGLCFIIQINQAICHYKTLGLNTNYLWLKYADKLLNKPHPVLGFFLFEHPMLTGMFGQDMAYYMACRSKSFREIHLGLYARESAEFDELGQPSFRTYVSFGNSRKYFAMLNKLSIKPAAVRREISENFELLYRKPISKQEYKLLLEHKASNPIIAESFDFNNDAKMHAASVYLLQEPVILVSEGGLPETQLLSLMDLFPEIKRKADCDEYKWLFQMSTAYDLLIKEVESYRNCKIVVRSNQRSISTRIPFMTVATKSPINLLDVVRRRWFNQVNVRGSTYSHNAAYDWYKSKPGFQWLSDTHDESLARAEIFSDPVSMYNFVSSISHEPKVVRAFCPMDTSASTQQAIASMIRYTQWKGRVLSTDRQEMEEERSFEIRKLAEKIWRISRLPEHSNPVEILKNTLKMAPDFLSETTLKTAHYEMTRGHIALGVLINFVKSAPKTQREKEILSSYIESVGMGVLGSYERRQKFNPESQTYDGLGIFKGKFDGVKVELRISDNNLEKITINRISDLSRAAHALKQFIKDHGWISPTIDQPSKNPHFDASRCKLVYQGGKSRFLVEERKIDWELRIMENDLKLEVTEWGQIRLVATDVSRTKKGKEIHKTYTVLSFRVTRDDISDNSEIISDEPIVETDEVLDYWVKNKTMPTAQLVRNLRRDPKTQAWAAKLIRERALGMFGSVFKLPVIKRELNEAEEVVDSSVNNSSEEKSEIEVKFNSLDLKLPDKIVDYDSFFMDDPASSSVSEDQEGDNDSNELDLINDEDWGDDDRFKRGGGDWADDNASSKQEDRTKDSKTDIGIDLKADDAFLDKMYDSNPFAMTREDLTMYLNDGPGFTNKLFDDLLMFFLDQDSRRLFRFLQSPSLKLVKLYDYFLDKEVEFASILT